MSKTRVCVEVDGQLSRLFSITERSNGDLVISLQSSDFYRDAGSTEHFQDHEIKTQKYSVHRSIKSPEQINVLKHQLTFADGTETTSTHYTKALKQTNKYAAICAVRTQDLSLPKYRVESEPINLKLDAYQSATASFFYMIFVCNHEAEPIKAHNSYSYKYLNFKYFRIAVLWGFINAPSHSSSLKTHILTVDPADIDEVNRGKLKDAEGFDAEEVINFFDFVSEQSKGEFYSVIRQSNLADLALVDEIFSLPITNKPLYLND